MRMKVAVVSYHFAENCVAIASALARYARVRLIMPKHEAEPYLPDIDPGVELKLFDKPRVRHGWRQVKTLATIHRDIRSFSPDVLHVQGGHPWFTLSLPLLSRYPLVVTIHDSCHHLGDADSKRYPQWILDRGARCADEVIVHAPQVKQELLARLHLSDDRVHVTPIPLVIGDRGQQHTAEQEGTILFFGRIWPYKGLQHLIAAEPLITQKFPQAKFVITGTGEDFARYRRMMVHPRNFVVHNRYVSNDERGELFRQASVVVLPYLEASQSGVALMSYYYGKPVVATTVGGLPEIVEDGCTGFLVPPGDERSLAEATLRLLRDKELRHRCGARGKQKLQNELSADLAARQSLTVYQQAIARKSRLSVPIPGPLPEKSDPASLQG